MTGLRLVAGEEERWLRPQRQLEGTLTESNRSDHGEPRLTASSYPVSAAQTSAAFSSPYTRGGTVSFLLMEIRCINYEPLTESTAAPPASHQSLACVSAGN